MAKKKKSAPIGMNFWDTLPKYRLVKFAPDMVPPDYDFKDIISHKARKPYPLYTELMTARTLVFFGEIEGMVGHCIVLDSDRNRWFVGIHTDNFVPLTEEEL